MGPYASVTLVANVGENLGKWGSSGHPFFLFNTAANLGTKTTDLPMSRLSPNLQSFLRTGVHSDNDLPASLRPDVDRASLRLGSFLWVRG